MSETLMDEDISILSSTWIPNAEEANVIMSRNSARREMIEGIDEEIEALEARRHNLVVACDIGSAIVAPIRKIPAEILVEIFILCIPPIPTKRRRRHGMPDPESLRSQDVSGLLGDVCRAWHTIVNDDPRIWSSLVLDTKIEATEDVSRLLKMSKSHPLDIFIQPVKWFDHGPEAGEADAIFEMLRRELWRIRSFICDLGSPWEMEVFPQGFSIIAPMLQTFSHIRADSPSLAVELGRSHCPELRSVVLSYSESIVRSLVGNPIPTVRHLVVRFHRPMALNLQLLSTFPNLISLHFSGEATVDDQEAPSTVILQSLTSLRVEMAGALSLQHLDLLSHLYVPSLQSLELVAYNAVDGIRALCGDGTVKLRHLHICHGELHEIQPMLQQLNHLDTLIIEESSGLEILLPSLAPRDRDYSPVFPQLTTLVIAKTYIPPGPFVDFLHRRTRADWEEAVPGLVTSLKLRKPDGLDMDMCQHFAETHSATVHLMSVREFQEISLTYDVETRGSNEGWGGGWGGGGGEGGEGGAGGAWGAWLE
jgi:hypothetical protein